MSEELLFKINIQGNDKVIAELARVKGESILVDKSIQELNKSLKAGKVGLDDYAKQVADLTAKKRALKQDGENLTRTINLEQAAFKGAEGSMVRINAELGAMRDKYRNLSEAERENIAVGGKLLQQIQAHDDKIKKLDATIGNHQRNVGNYKTGWQGLAETIKQGIPGMSQMVGTASIVSANMNAMSGAAAGAGRGMLLLGGAIGVGILAFSGLSGAMKEGFKYAMDMEARLARLSFALDGSAQATKRMTDLAGMLSSKSLFKKGEIMDAEILALNMGRTEAQTRKMIETAMGMSRAMGIDLNTAMMQLNGSFAGTLRGMGKYDIALKDMTKEQLAAGGAVDVLHKKFAKFGQEGLDTVEGRMKTYEKTLAGFKRNLATGFIPVVNAALEAINKLMGAGGDKKDNRSIMQRYGGEQADAMQNTDTKGQDAIIAKNKALADSYFKLWQQAAPNSAQRAQMAKMYDEQLQVVEQLQKQQTDLKGTPYIDKEKLEKAKEDAERAKKEAEERDARRRDSIKANEDFILQLTRQAIDDQIAAMKDGQKKEEALARDKYEDTRILIQKEKLDRLEAIDETIKDTKAEGEELKKLQGQKVAIEEQTNKRLETLRIAHMGELADIDIKYSKETEDNKITSKYSADVARVTEEGKLKLDALREYYAQKGTLTKAETQQQKDDELKLAIEVAQKKYDLLYAEISARKALGTITKEEYDKQLADIARLYGEVKKLGGEQAANKTDGTKKPDAITGGIMQMFDIPEGQAQQIKAKVESLLGQISDMWLSAQQNRIKAELKAETAKVDAQAKRELSALEIKRKKGLITEAQYAAEKEKIEEQTAIKKDKLNREAFEKEKKLRILSAIMAGALAVVNALTMQPFIVGLVMAALTAVTVGLQVAAIAGTKYEGARGGLLRGASHRDGGIKYQMGGDIVELEGGEAVINKQSIASNDILTVTGTPRQIASDINSYRGYGVSFAAGGYTPVSTPRSAGVRIDRTGVDQVVDERLQELKVYVLETDITETQGKVKRIQVDQTW